MRFKLEKIEGGLRFTASDGWVDLMLLDDSRANIWVGTFNGTPAPVFGSRLWHLLKETMPEAGLRVVAYEGERDEFVESILVHAGFTKEATRRAWGDGGQDTVVYSILAPEVVYEVTGNGNGPAAATGGEVIHG